MTAMAATPMLRDKRLPDPFRDGLARGWHVVDASTLERDLVLDADVAIVGTGAGGGTAAEILSEAGLKVVLVEEGPLATSSDFRMRESDAYPQLYQESAARKTRDKAINILQGRCVGGSTTVNWTSSFRTPPSTLDYWRRALGIEGFSENDLAPWFERMEARLSIAPWPVAPNANNDALRRGALALGIPAHAIRRNVKGCWNIGYCGMGCPDQRQAVDAGDDDSGGAGARRDAAHAHPRMDARARRRAHHRADLRRARRTRHRPDRAPRARARANVHRRRRRHRHAGAFPAQQAARSARQCSASAPSCIRPWCRQR